MSRRALLPYLCSSALAGGALIAASLGSATAAPPKVQFSRQVLPLINRECGGCHRGPAAPGGYSVESAERLMGGGRHGKAVVPGKSGESTLVKYLTGELKPLMPPGKPLPLDTIALVRRWIDEGARIDSMTAPAETMGIMRGAMPLKTRPMAPKSAPSGSHFLPGGVSQSAPVTALAYSPDGKVLAVGGYRAVRLLDPATGAVLHTLPGPADQVLSLTWSADGSYLAAAGGVSGAYGEVCVWEGGLASGQWGKPKVLKEHTDAIYGVAWRPGTTEFATASIDKTAKLWDLKAGKSTRTLKDHVDVVFAVAFSADGKWLATGSADRAVKLYQVGAAGPPASLPHGEAVTAVAFSPKGDVLASACADKRVRVWPVKTEAVQNPLRGHDEGEAVNAVAFSADGSLFVWGAQNRKVRLWSGDLSNQRREMSDSTDWVYSVAASPDGKRVAAGAGDGKLYLWNAADGKLERTVAVGAGASAVAAAGAEAGK